VAWFIELAVTVGILAADEFGPRDQLGSAGWLIQRRVLSAADGVLGTL
jgi:hypothetical protein